MTTRVTMSDSAVPIQLGPGFRIAPRIAFLLVSRNSFRLAFPQPAPRDARGAACVLSRRCWQDGSFHYSYFQASLVFSSFLRSYPRGARPVAVPATNPLWISLVLPGLAASFGSAPRPRDHFSRLRKAPRYYPTLLASGKPDIAPAVDIGEFHNLADICLDAKTSLRAANELHLLPFSASRNRTIRRLFDHSTGGWEWWAL